MRFCGEYFKKFPHHLQAERKRNIVTGTNESRLGSFFISIIVTNERLLIYMV